MINGVRIFLQKTIDEGNFDLDTLNKSGSERVLQEHSKASNIWELLGLIFILILVILVAYYISKLVANLKLGQLKDSNFKVIDTFQFATNKMLMIVQVGERYMLIAVSKEQVQYLTELNEDDIVFNMESSQEKRTLNFKTILDSIKKRKQ